MKKKSMMVFLGTLMTLSLGTAIADSDDYHRGPRDSQHYGQHRNQPPKPYVIKERIKNQEKAIRDGYRNGSLTREEARTLKHNLAKIKTEYLRAEENDDRFSMRERERLDHMLDRNDRMIRKLENNRIERF